MSTITEILAAELNQSIQHIQNVINLIDSGCTIPFIARYRKELHGSMDDTTLRSLSDRLTYLRNLEKRREQVKSAIEAQGKLTPALSTAIDQAATMTEVDDLYAPYKQKKRTRATIAREMGLEPLAQAIFLQQSASVLPEKLAASCLNPEAGVNTLEDALQGANDILAEQISEDAVIRKQLRVLAVRQGSMTCQAAKDAGDSVYRTYYEFSAPAGKLKNHQVLAINRGEKEGYLKVNLEIPEEFALSIVQGRWVKGQGPCGKFVERAARDAYSRLIEPSIQRQIRSELTEQAGESAIQNFALNLRPLLMQPPFKGKVTMGLDPGYRNGCKVAVLDSTGKVLDTAIVYPTFSRSRREEAIQTLKKLIETHGVTYIAIGNGTASRETEAMTVDLLKLVSGVSYMIVNEAGASVYSASKLAAEEFPQYDVNLRSAISIARRLQDPLAELVKIDPQSIGVGQYQHDVPQKRLTETLDGVVEDCVNQVGVDVNTASPSLLQRVSGLSTAISKNIVAYREENGKFTSRRQLLKVPKLGPKAYEQCAGFLRVPESGQILDNTAVHPESYETAKKLLELCGYSLEDVAKGRISQLPARLKQVGLEEAAVRCGAGVPTLQDIVKELLKPGRDPRDELPKPILRTDVLSISDLKPGMVLTGTVRNVIDFGVFVDIGVHQDGLVHISKLCSRYIKHPSEVVSVGDVVKVAVLEVDEKRNRISLTMKDLPKE